MPRACGVNRNYLIWPRAIFTWLFRMKIAFSPPEEAGHLPKGLRNSSGLQGTQTPLACELLTSPWLAPLCVCVSGTPSLGLLKEETGKE